jgi:asparagine N-glycosylation enzyme membrane subunit Stt3
MPNLELFTSRRIFMALSTIFLIVLLLLVVGAIPAWPHSRNWGYGPSGGLGLLVLILIVLVVVGKI